MGADLEKIDDDSRLKVSPQTGKCEPETNQRGGCCNLDSIRPTTP